MPGNQCLSTLQKRAGPLPGGSLARPRARAYAGLGLVKQEDQAHDDENRSAWSSILSLSESPSSAHQKVEEQH